MWAQLLAPGRRHRCSRGIYDHISSGLKPGGHDPRITIARLEEQIKAKDDLLLEKDKQIKLLEQNNQLKQTETNKKPFFKSLFTCFKKQRPLFIFFLFLPFIITN